MAPGSPAPLLALTQGDAAGVGPEILLKVGLVGSELYRPLLIAERSALEAIAPVVDGAERLELVSVSADDIRDGLAPAERDVVPILDPVAVRRELTFGTSGPRASTCRRRNRQCL